MNTISKRRAGHGIVDLSEAIQHWSYDVMGELTFGKANRLVSLPYTLIFIGLRHEHVGVDEG